MWTTRRLAPARIDADLVAARSQILGPSGASTVVDAALAEVRRFGGHQGEGLSDAEKVTSSRPVREPLDGSRSRCAVAGGVAAHDCGMMCPDRWAGLLYRLTRSACILDPMDYGRSRARAQLAARRAARDEFGRRLGGESAAPVLARADREYPAIAARIPPTRLGARNLLRTGAYAAALQRALVDAGADPTVANELVSDVVLAAILPAREALARLARIRHRDRLRRTIWLSDLMRRYYFTAPDWEMTDVPVEGGFGMDITRCVVAEFFAGLGMSELCQRAICDQDNRLAAHHGLLFERSGTLAGGADRCDFRYCVPVGGASRMIDGR